MPSRVTISRGDRVTTNEGGWWITRQGIRKVANKDNGKGFVTIQWVHISQSKTGIPGLYEIKVKCNDTEMFMVDKVISGTKIEGLFDLKKDALKYIDKCLIKLGHEPKYVFKRK